MDTTEIIRETFSDVLQKTIEKKINWVIINPNAIRWVKQDAQERSVVTLQKQQSPHPNVKEIYILIIQSGTIQPNLPAPPNRTIRPRPNPIAENPPIQFNSSTDPILNEIFSKIFNEVMIDASRRDEEKKIITIRNLLKGL